MAKVFVRKLGGVREEVEATTIADLNLGSDYKAVVNGNSAASDTPLKDGDFITIAKNVDGNMADVLLKLKDMVLTFDGKRFLLNGEALTKSQAVKVATAIANVLDIEIN